MRTELSTADDADARAMYRLGGYSALVLGVAYIAIVAVYATVGAPPREGEAWLVYAAGKTTAWWAIVGLSVLTDFLFLPIAFALYLALRDIDRNAMLLATAFVSSFVFLDLAVTWTNITALVSLADQYAAATTDAERAAAVGAANHASAVLSSTLGGVYSIVTLALGILLIGWVMLRSTFGRTVAYVGIVIGILGIVSVAGPLLLGGLSLAIVIASVLTTVWVLIVGYRLVRLGRSGALDRLPPDAADSLRPSLVSTARLPRR